MRTSGGCYNAAPHSRKPFKPKFSPDAANWSGFQGIHIIAHLSLLSQYTPGQGDIVLRLFSEVVDSRIRRAKADRNKDPEMQIADVKKIIERILKENDVPMKKLEEIDVDSLYSEEEEEEEEAEWFGSEYDTG